MQFPACGKKCYTTALCAPCAELLSSWKEFHSHLVNQTIVLPHDNRYVKQEYIRLTRKRRHAHIHRRPVSARKPPANTGDRLHTIAQSYGVCTRIERKAIVRNLLKKLHPDKIGREHTESEKDDWNYLVGVERQQ